MKSNVSINRLREMLDYDPETGMFTWLKISSTKILSVGQVAGRMRSDGYLSIGIDRSEYLAHRLAWFWMTGAWPSGNIDHKDGNGLNNRWSNLRVATQSQNRANSRRASRNTSGIKGVSWSKRRGQWRATICKHQKQIELGYYSTLDAAQQAYAKAAINLFGEFAKID